MEELTSWKVITVLIGLISAGVIYWRRLKDKADDDLKAKDEELAKEIEAAKKEAKNGRAEIYKQLDVNQKKVLEKLDEVLDGQHSMDLKMSKAFLLIDQHTKDLQRLSSKQDKDSATLSELSKQMAVSDEWKKRVEDKLQLK